MFCTPKNNVLNVQSIKESRMYKIYTGFSPCSFKFSTSLNKETLIFNIGLLFLQSHKRRHAQKSFSFIAIVFLVFFWIGLSSTTQNVQSCRVFSLLYSSILDFKFIVGAPSRLCYNCPSSFGEIQVVLCEYVN